MEWIGQLAMSVATGVAASWVAVQFALGRFYREKWWEQRFAAYTAIMEALHRFNRIVNKERARLKRDPNGPPEHTREELTQATDAIWRALDLGELFISPEMIAHLKTVTKDISDASKVKDLGIPQLVKVLGDALPKAAEIARQDLRLKR